MPNNPTKEIKFLVEQIISKKVEKEGKGNKEKQQVKNKQYHDRLN